MAKQYETVIGLEVHVELATKTKIFCGCSTAFGGAPNTHTCPVCTGMPGSLPVLNKQVVEYAMAVGLALNCDINQYCKFDRKNYFYPDNHQISQLYLPICINGSVEIETAGGKKSVGIHEIHMEEDAGKLVHDDWADCSLVDYNRSGVPLIEIVSEPDMRSADEVIAYLEKLRTTIQYLGASDCKLNEGSMRAAVVEKNENVMTDLSGLLEGKIDFPKLLEQQRGYFDALKTWISYCSQYEKFMFGTDWPLANYGDYIEVVKWLIPEEKWGKVFYENAKRIYGL